MTGGVWILLTWFDHPAQGLEHRQIPSDLLCQPSVLNFHSCFALHVFNDNFMHLCQTSSCYGRGFNVEQLLERACTKFRVCHFNCIRVRR